MMNKLKIILVLFTFSALLSSCIKTISPDKNNTPTAKPQKSSTELTKESIPSIIEVINNHIVETSDCYEIARLTNPDIQGRVLFKLKIIQTGDIEEVKVIQNDFQNDDFIGCLKAAISAWKFPEQKEKVINIVCPFNFQLNDNKQ